MDNLSECLAPQKTILNEVPVRAIVVDAEQSGYGRSSSVRQSVRLQVLPKALFLEQLRRDRLRSDRAKTPVSLVVLQLQSTESRAGGDMRLALWSAQKSLRAIDSIGLLGERVLALLLPDTTKEGARLVAEKIVAGHPELSVSAAIQTYPEELFVNLHDHLEHIEGIDPLWFIDAPESKRFQSTIKRWMDVLGALSGLLILSPLMLATAMAVKLSSPGPIIFRQIRLGKDFTPFVFYKFRSMHANVDESIHREYVENLISGTPAAIDQDDSDQGFYKLTSDTRVTRIGNFIRKTSIDELPQLVNVLKGEMSLVGPRPPIPYEVENYQSWHLRRILEIKPGLTGLWQVEGRSRVSFDEMVRLDLRYSRDWSLLMDLKLLIRTVRVILECRGGA